MLKKKKKIFFRYLNYSVTERIKFNCMQTLTTHLIMPPSLSTQLCYDVLLSEHYKHYKTIKYHVLIK